MLLIRYPFDRPPPLPWQPDWQQPLGHHELGIARAPNGTRVPDWCVPMAFDASAAEPIPIFDGRVDFLAFHAPWEVRSAHQARRILAEVEAGVTSQFSVVVIRAALGGYQVGIGVDSLLTAVGILPDLDSAEQAGIGAVLEVRDAYLAELRSGVLAGWSGKTPLFRYQLETVRYQMPIRIRRGPITGVEVFAQAQAMGEVLAQAREARINPFRSEKRMLELVATAQSLQQPRFRREFAATPTSSDLPVAAVWVDGAIAERRKEAITWSDDLSRELHRARQVLGEHKVRRRETK